MFGAALAWKHFFQYRCSCQLKTRGCSRLAGSVTGVQLCDEDEAPFWLGKGREDIALLARDITFFRSFGMCHGILAPATSSLSSTLHHLHPQLKISASA